jgi:hypothetical protein
MAKRAHLTSVKNLPGESQPAERWWQTPTVIAAIIAATAAIIVAIIGLGVPKSKPPQPVNIEQETHGPNSPAVGGVGGNVTITLPPRDKQP